MTVSMHSFPPCNDIQFGCVLPSLRLVQSSPCYGHAIAMAAWAGVIEWPKTGGLISKTLKAEPDRPLHKALHAVDCYFF